jgi:shikimate kinase
MTSPVAVLVGPPGAGKSTVGPLLADLLGTEFTDTDAIVEAMAGKPVSDIFVTDGEATFRELERTAVGQGLDSYPGILALGGGAVMDAGTQRSLAGHQVVYLETGFAAAAKRVGLAAARPLLLGNPRAKLKELLEQRLPVYRALAWLTVTTDGREPQEIADEIAATISERIAAAAGEGMGAAPDDADDLAGGAAADEDLAGQPGEAPQPAPGGEPR